MPDHTIVCQDLARSFDGRVAVDHLDLQVEAGTVLALHGPNGGGKTTTIRLLNGVRVPDTGSSRVLGMDPATEGDELRRHTGVLTENAGLDDRLTARENLVAVARMRGMSRAAADQRVMELLERFGMSAHADTRCQGFSTGQRRRVALARAFVADPQVLFLDEPTSGLDPAATDDVVTLIDQMAREHGRTVVLCTHFLEEAAQVADQLAILQSGRLLVSGSPDALAAEFWPERQVDVDLGQPAGPVLIELTRTLPGVDAVASTARGARFDVADADVVPRLVRALVEAGAAIHGVGTVRRDLGDIYFAVLDRFGLGHLGLRAADGVDPNAAAAAPPVGPPPSAPPPPAPPELVP